MALLNLEIAYPEPRPTLRLVPTSSQAWRTGAGWAARRARRARTRARRRVVVLVLAATGGLAVLGFPGHALGGVTGSGLPTDLATGSAIASGTVYVVQSGDTVTSIARAINPIDPGLARSALVRELRSDVVVPGEHVLVP